MSLSHLFIVSDTHCGNWLAQNALQFQPLSPPCWLNAFVVWFPGTTDVASEPLREGDTMSTCIRT